MNKVSSFFAAAAMVGAVCVSSAAMAQSGSYTGDAVVQKGLVLTCAVEADFDSSNGTVDLSISTPEPSCAALSIISNPHTYSTSGSTVTINDVNVNTITNGGCLDDLVVTYNATNDTITVNDVLDARDGGGDCSIESDGPLTK